MKQRWMHIPHFTGNVFFSLFLDGTILSAILCPHILVLAFSFLADSWSSGWLTARCIGSANACRLPVMEAISQHPWGSQPGGKLFLVARTACGIYIVVSRCFCLRWRGAWQEEEQALILQRPGFACMETPFPFNRVGLLCSLQINPPAMLTHIIHDTPS